MRNGVIKRQDGRKYRATRDFVKIFKAFWHWYQKVARKAGKEVGDITIYLDSSGEKPEWVYLNEDQVRQFADNCNLKYKTIVMFLFDTGIRAPTEMMNVKVSDLSPDYKELNIRDETSKTFGRKIKLMICSGLLKRYVEENNLNNQVKFLGYISDKDMIDLQTIESIENDIISLKSQLKKESQMNGKVELNIEIQNKRNRIETIKDRLIK